MATEKLHTPVFRLSFPQLFKAVAYQENDPKFSTAAIFTPAKFTNGEKVKFRAMMKALDAEARKAFGKGLKDLPSSYKIGMRDGADKSDLEGYGEGTKFTNFTTLHRPGVVDRTKNTISPEDGNESEIYAGCYCRATITAYSFNKGGGKGVAFGLSNIQKIADGPRLDNHTKAEDDFDDEIDSAWQEEDEGDDDDFLD